MRLLLLSSEGQGEDWFSKSQQIDEFVVHEGLDFADESVYLLFDRAPAAVAAGEGSCRIGRSVIGPRKDYPRPFQVEDFVAASAYVGEVGSAEWAELWQEAQGLWEELQRQGKKVSPSFTVKLKRRLEPRLTLKTEVFFLS